MKKRLKDNKELAIFLTQRCKERKLSFRNMSLNAGLSPSTVHNIVSGKSRPNVSSLNAVADYLGIKRVFLWQIAGLIEDDMDYDTEAALSDPRVKFYFAQVDKMPEEKREVILKVIETLVVNLKS